jgi:hypothetical protein
MLKSLLNKWDWLMGTGNIWLRTGTVVGSCEDIDDTSGSIKCWKIKSTEASNTCHAVILCSNKETPLPEQN